MLWIGRGDDPYSVYRPRAELGRRFDRRAREISADDGEACFQFHEGTAVTGAHEDRIAIVMATYNGAAYVAEQIDSILAQDHRNWHLTIRDDGSTDGTVDILRAYVGRHPRKISLVTDDLGNLGPAANFSRLLELTNAPYVALSDQDDVWLPHKLSRSLLEMQRLEDTWGADVPCLVFSDLIVVNKELNTISGSFWNYQGIDPATATKLSYMLVTNVVTGCTTLINLSLLRLVQAIPPVICVHDWWIALCACAFGRIFAIEDPLAQYRKHGRNVIGPRRQILRVLDYLRRFRYNRRRLMQIFEQAAAFRKQFKTYLSLDQVCLLDKFISLPEMPFVRRLNSLHKYGYYRNPNPIYPLAVALLINRRQMEPEQNHTPSNSPKLDSIQP